MCRNIVRLTYGVVPNHTTGMAALVMADRRITAGDLTYEPAQLKFGFLSERALIAVAGDITVHSEAILRTQEQAKARADISAPNIALIYGHAIQDINPLYAEDKYLAKLGLNTDTFLAQQREYSDSLIAQIVDQMQTYKVADEDR